MSTDSSDNAVVNPPGEQLRRHAFRPARSGANTGRLQGPYSDLERRESRHVARLDPRARVLLIIATGVLAPLTMALAVRGDQSWRPVGVVSLAASGSSLYS